jgi:hypothetical protein
MEKECSCYMYNFTITNSKRACQYLEDQICNAPIMNKVNADLSKYCGVECPEECDSVLYSFSTSSSLFPTSSYAQKLLADFDYYRVKYPNMTVEELRSSILSVNVYFEELKYTEIAQEAQYSVPDLVSSIGGSLGNYLHI